MSVFADINLSLLIAVPLCSDDLSTVCLDVMSILDSSICSLCFLHSPVEGKEVEVGVMDGHISHPIFMKKEISITIFFSFDHLGAVEEDMSTTL